MSKRKAFICSILYAIVLIALMIGAIYVQGKEIEINLYVLVTSIIGTYWLIGTISKFYDWLRK